jgi:hypothetical protein
LLINADFFGFSLFLLIDEGAEKRKRKKKITKKQIFIVSTIREERYKNFKKNKDSKHTTSTVKDVNE